MTMDVRSTRSLPFLVLYLPITPFRPYGQVESDRQDSLVIFYWPRARSQNMELVFSVVGEFTNFTILIVVMHVGGSKSHALSFMAAGCDGGGKKLASGDLNRVYLMIILNHIHTFSQSI